jgi:hypothetical protein
VRAQGVHGEIMEDFLDEKLGREHIKAHVVPGFLMNDPDFAPTQDVAELQQHAMLHGGVATPMTVKSGASKKIESIYEAPKGTDGKKKASEEPSSSTLPVLPPTPQSAHRASIKPASKPYYLWDEDTKVLDRYFYGVLQHSITGPWATLLRGVMLPSYVQLIMKLHRHKDLSQSRRKTAALENMSNLAYHGDPQAWVRQCMKGATELMASKCTIYDVIMMNVMNSMKGKSAILHHKIGEDINNNLEMEHQDNLYDMLQGYAGALATTIDHTTHGQIYTVDGESTVQELQQALTKLTAQVDELSASKAKPKGSTKQCSKCGKNGHTEETCWDFKGHCTTCGEYGHQAKDCVRVKTAREKAQQRRQEQGGADQRHKEQGGDEQQPPDRAAMAQQQLNMAAIRARLNY